MARKFNVPQFYRSSAIGRIKQVRLQADPRKKDLSPTVLELGALRLKIARHFGFCFGVENAIEIAYRAVEENTGKRIYLLSEMIHNPQVNADLVARGVKFLMDTGGNRLISFDELTPEDIVIVPAFGTTLEYNANLLTAESTLIFTTPPAPLLKKCGNDQQSSVLKIFQSLCMASAPMRKHERHFPTAKKPLQQLSCWT